MRACQCISLITRHRNMPREARIVKFHGSEGSTEIQCGRQNGTALAGAEAHICSLQER